MITDIDLSYITIGFSLLAMGFILIYGVLETNVRPAGKNQ